MTKVTPALSGAQGFGIEFMITFVLVLVVFGAAADSNNSPNVKGSAPLAIGLSISACHMFAVSFFKENYNVLHKLFLLLILFTDRVYWLQHEPRQDLWTRCHSWILGPSLGNYFTEDSILYVCEPVHMYALF